MDTYTIERIYSAEIDQSNAINAAADKEVTRDVMATFYRDCIIADKKDGLGRRVDFAVLNKAIIERWSLSSLAYIKNLAWKQIIEASQQSRASSPHST